jgi:predicted DNA-binding protein (MmcQ/YjbR family)
MATIKQALRVMRSVCLSLPGAAEKAHYGETCFAGYGKMFASCGEKSGVGRIVVQLEKEHARRLVASNPRFAPYLRQKNCVWIHVADIDDWDQIRSLVLESYRLNVPDAAPGDAVAGDGGAADKPGPRKKKSSKKK